MSNFSVLRDRYLWDADVCGPRVHRLLVLGSVTLLLVTVGLTTLIAVYSPIAAVVNGLLDLLVLITWFYRVGYHVRAHRRRSRIETSP